MEWKSTGLDLWEDASTGTNRIRHKPKMIEDLKKEARSVIYNLASCAGDPLGALEDLRDEIELIIRNRKIVDEARLRRESRPE